MSDQRLIGKRGRCLTVGLRYGLTGVIIAVDLEGDPQRVQMQWDHSGTHQRNRSWMLLRNVEIVSATGADVEALEGKP